MAYGGVHSGEGFRKGIAVLTTVAAGLAVASCSSSPKPSSCLSPRAVSQTYEGDPNADSLNQATWRTGIEIDTQIPADTQGMVVSFRGPNDDWDSTHDSKLISSERAGAVAVKIGHGAVVFSTQLKGSSGSAVCDTKPASTFGTPEPFDVLTAKGVLVPAWRRG